MIASFYPGNNILHWMGAVKHRQYYPTNNGNHAAPFASCLLSGKISPISFWSRAMPDFVAAIDQGTTSTRFMIFDHEGTVHAKAQIEQKFRPV